MKWEDIIKNQISVTRQKLRSSKTSIPEEDDPPDCFEKIDAIVREFNNLAKIFDEGATLIYDLEFRNQLTNRTGGAVPSGAIVYNTNTNKLQVWNGSSWNDCF